MTRSNLTAAEDRVRDLEKALSSLFPGIDLDSLIASIHSDHSAMSSDRNVSQSTKKPPLDEKESREANSASESLPHKADGFDWTETTVRLSEISDGMAALSINPEGAGYLGKCHSLPPSIHSVDDKMTRCYFKRRASSNSIRQRAGPRYGLRTVWELADSVSTLPTDPL